MKSPNRLGLYADVKEILDEALRSNGGTFVVDSPGAAVHWRQRAYKFRKLYAESIAPAPSPYDRLTLPRVNGSCEIVIKIIGAPGKFIPHSVPDDDLPDATLNFVQQLARKIDGED